MRDLRSGRDLDRDQRMESIHRVLQKPVTARWYRLSAPTLRAEPTESLKCTIVGRIDPFSATRVTSTEKSTKTGEAAQQRWRFESPYPTDSEDTTIDCKPQDRVVISEVSYRAINVVIMDGCVEALLETWK